MVRFVLLLTISAALVAPGRGQHILLSAGADLHAAIDRAAAHDTLILIGGHWDEAPYIIRKPLTILGRDGAQVTPRGSSSIFRIMADSVTLSGLHLSGAPKSSLHDNAAVLVEGGHGCTISDNRLDGNYFGIYLKASNRCRIMGNQIAAYGEKETGSGNGIHLWKSRGTLVADNQIRGHRDGIYLEFADSVEVRGNRSFENLRYGLHFMFSNACQYRDNVFERNGAGVAVMYSARVDMEHNVFRHNWGPTSYGLLLKDINDSRIVGNRFELNTTAVHSEGSTRLRFEGNLVSQNGRAVNLLASSVDNVFVGNDFVGNTLDVSTNSRQNFNRFESNYWSSYAGYDLDRDGTGDVAHRPVRLFAYLVERNPVAMVLLRSLFIDLLDAAERVFPVLSPEMLTDPSPSMKPHTP